MIITPAVPEDLGGIMALEKSGFETGRWSKKAWLAELENEDRCVLSARVGDDLVGIATFSSVADSADLLRIIVTPKMRSKGIGRKLLSAGLQWAQAVGATQMLLEVGEDNPAGRALYDEFGFDVVARRPDYYGPGRHAIVMARELHGTMGANESGWSIRD